jgi:membrane protease YdiL (CAAX protease family)
VSGLIVAGTVVLLDSLLFAGASLPRIRSLAEEPFWFRLAIVIYSPLAEELVYRFIIMALLAWVVYLLLSRVYHDALPLALWTGILGAATLFGLAHIGNAPNAPHPFLRAITLNGLAGIVFGWLYWKRGFEAAVLAHFAADALIYLGLANVL